MVHYVNRSTGADPSAVSKGIFILFLYVPIKQQYLGGVIGGNHLYVIFTHLYLCHLQIDRGKAKQPFACTTGEVE